MERINTVTACIQATRRWDNHGKQLIGLLVVLSPLATGGHSDDMLALPLHSRGWCFGTYHPVASPAMGHVAPWLCKFVDALNLPNCMRQPHPGVFSPIILLTARSLEAQLVRTFISIIKFLRLQNPGGATVIIIIIIIITINDEQVMESNYWTGRWHMTSSLSQLPHRSTTSHSVPT